MTDRRDNLLHEIARLRRRCEELEREVEWLRDLFMPPYLNFPGDWRLTRSESVILAALYASKSFLTREAAHVAACGDEPDSDLKIIDVHVHKLRKKLRPTMGEAIETVWGRGYKLSNDARSAIAAALDAGTADAGLRLAS